MPLRLVDADIFADIKAIESQLDKELQGSFDGIAPSRVGMARESHNLILILEALVLGVFRLHCFSKVFLAYLID